MQSNHNNNFRFESKISGPSDMRFCDSKSPNEKLSTDRIKSSLAKMSSVKRSECRSSIMYSLISAGSFTSVFFLAKEFSKEVIKGIGQSKIKEDYAGSCQPEIDFNDSCYSSSSAPTNLTMGCKNLLDKYCEFNSANGGILIVLLLLALLLFCVSLRAAISFPAAHCRRRGMSIGCVSQEYHAVVSEMTSNLDMKHQEVAPSELENRMNNMIEDRENLKKSKFIFLMGDSKQNAKSFPRCDIYHDFFRHPMFERRIIPEIIDFLEGPKKDKIEITVLDEKGQEKRETTQASINLIRASTK